MRKIVWSPSASTNLEQICDYIANDSPLYARLTARRIIGIIEEIPRFPWLGRVVPEYMREDLREKIFGAYRIVYRVTDDAIDIAAIFRCSRSLESVLPLATIPRPSSRSRKTKR